MDTWIILIAAATNLVTVAMVLVIKYDLVQMARDILKVEVATNSMKDALVVASERAAHAEGKEEGRKEDKVEKKIERLEGLHAAQPIVEAPTPVAVADDRTAMAAEQTAEAAERSATATERVAAATEKKKT